MFMFVSTFLHVFVVHFCYVIGNTGIQLQSEITPSFANDIEDDGNDMHCSVQESAPGLVRSRSF